MVETCLIKLRPDRITQPFLLDGLIPSHCGIRPRFRATLEPNLYNTGKMKIGLLLVLCGSSILFAQPAAKYRQGHSHIGAGFNEGPRQRPWEIPGAGRVHFAITHKNPETQKWFDQGVALLHSFWFYEAERSFRWCLQLEPDNAMAWWGLARSQSGQERGKEFLQEAVKRKGSVSERERLYIEADTAGALPELGASSDSRGPRQILERL